MLKSQGLSSSVVLQRSSVRVAGKLTDGSTASLFKGVSSEGREIVLKVVSFPPDHPSLKGRFQREIEVLEAIPPHQNIVKVVDWKEDQARGVLAEEFCHLGNLRVLCKNQELVETQVLSILRDVTSGLVHLHSYGVSHRDLRPCNIFLGNDFKCRIGDFGSALQTTYESVPEDQKMEVVRDIETNTVPCFRAPEQIDSTLSQHIGTQVDVWGLGCLAFGLLFRENAFNSKLIADQRNGKYRKVGKKVSDFWVEFFGMVFTTDPLSRPKAEEILQQLAQLEVPRVIPRPDVPPAFSPKSTAVIGLFRAGAGWWVRISTNNCNVPPDFHYIWRLVTKLNLKPFKVGKVFSALQKRPVNKTRVAIKVLMVTHLLDLYGRSSNHEVGLMRTIDAVERSWAPNSSVPGDEFKNEYFCGLIRLYVRLLRMKLQLQTVLSVKGDWTGGKVPDPTKVNELITLWAKFMHLANGLFMGGVSQLTELKNALAGLLMEEKLKLAAYIAQCLTALSRTQTHNRALLPGLIQAFQHNYQQTRLMAVNLKAFNPLLHFIVPPDAYSQPRPAAAQTKAQTSPAPEVPVLGHHKSRGSSQPPNIDPETSPDASEKSETMRENRERHKQESEQTLNQWTPEGQKSKPEGRRSITPIAKPAIPHLDDLFGPPIKPSRIDIRQLDSNTSSASTPVQAYHPEPEVPMFPAPAMENPNTAPSQPKSEVTMFSPDEPWILKQNQLQFGPVLGIGSSCQVHRGLYKRTPVAIKVMKANVVNVDLKREFVREVNAMLRLRHPNLVLFMGACIEYQLAIVTEFCAGESLFKLLHERKNVMLSWQQKLKMCKDIAQGMTYLHEITPPIIHRDLKSLNLLLHEPVNGPSDPILIKITDFGVSKILDEPSHMTGQMGTCHWMAPEVIANRPYDLSADVYSYGIVLWEIVCRDTPYRNIPPMAIAERVLRFGERPNLTMVPSSCPAALRDLMIRCWQTDSSKRPTFSEILDSLERIEV